MGAEKGASGSFGGLQPGAARIAAWEEERKKAGKLRRKIVLKLSTTWQRELARIVFLEGGRRLIL